MALPKYDPNQTHQPQLITEYFQHPDEGYLEYEPSTQRIRGKGPMQPPITHPIRLAGVLDGQGRSLVGTKQPYLQTCSEPGEHNRGCDKWHGCPFKALPYVGPMSLRIKKNEAVNTTTCYQFYESLDNRGRPISQNHLGLDGWKVDVTATTHPMLGYVPVKDQFGNVTGKVQSRWEREIPNLGPPWWPLLKKKGQPIPDAAALYPELVQGEEEEECGEKSEPSASQPSVSRSGRGKRTKSTLRRKRSGTASGKPPSVEAPSA